MASPSTAAGAADAALSGGAGASALSAFISKRAKAVHKKLQRISSYESQEKASLNQDQLRALASKPALDAVYAELNAVLAHVQQHEASTRSETDAEVARLTELANANAQRADDAHAQLAFLLQFLHLHSLFNRDSAVNPSAPPPEVPAALASTISSADIHALNPVLYAFANAPLFDATADDSATALGIIKRVRAADPSEITFTATVPAEVEPAAASTSVSTGISHARLAELVNALTAAPPVPTQFGALSFTDAEPDAVAPEAEYMPSTLDSTEAPIPMPVAHPAAAADAGVDAAIGAATAPAFLNFDADNGFSLGSGPVPPSAGGRILFMQASEVEGEAESEPVPAAQPAALSFGDAVDASAPGEPVAEPATTIEPEGGAVDGAPEAEAVPPPQPDATTSEPVPPVLRDLDGPAEISAPSAQTASAVDTAVAPAPAEPVAAKKIDWASLDDDDDESIHEDVLRSQVLGIPPPASTGQHDPEKPAESAQAVPAAAEAEATRLAKQVDKVKTNGGPSANGSGSGGGKTSNAAAGGRGSTSRASGAPTPAPLRKPEPVVDEDGFVMHTTKKTLRQQQLAAQQQQQQGNRSGGGRGGGASGGRGGGRTGRGGGAAGSGSGSGSGPGRKERREGSSGGAGGEGRDATGAVSGEGGAAANGHGRERSGGGGGGAGRGGQAGSGAGGPANANGAGANGRGRGRGRPSNTGGRQPSASGAAPASTAL
ncbi:hypothetical protein OC834_001267 [Tilletia horrida]|nr:hypothetical protein OC834_001267 [Tilletia horrida]